MNFTWLSCWGFVFVGVQLFLRGKAHVEWRITRGGERRTVKEDQYFIDEKLIVWGSGKHSDLIRTGSHPRPHSFDNDRPRPCLIHIASDEVISNSLADIGHALIHLTAISQTHNPGWIVISWSTDRYCIFHSHGKAQTIV